MKTIKAIIGIGFGILLGLSLTSCAPPEGCFYKTYRSFEFGSEYRERVNIYGDITITERPLSRTFTICSIEDELELDRLYFDTNDSPEVVE